MPLEVLSQLVALLVGGGAIYGGIRADLKGMHERISLAQADADRAHVRIDNLLNGGKP